MRDDISTARLAAIVDSCDAAIVATTLEGTVTSWNRSAERMFGYSAGEMIGAAISRIVPPEHRSEAADLLARLARGERVETLTTARLAKDGRRVDVSVMVSPIRDDRDHVVGMSQIARDVTDRPRLPSMPVMTGETLLQV